MNPETSLNIRRKPPFGYLNSRKRKTKSPEETAPADLSKAEGLGKQTRHVLLAQAFRAFGTARRFDDSLPDRKVIMKSSCIDSAFAQRGRAHMACDDCDTAVSVFTKRRARLRS